MNETISKQRSAEEKLAHTFFNQDMSRKFLDIAGVIILVLDTDGKVAIANTKAREILACGTEEIVGKDWADIFLPERIRGEIKAVFAKLISGDVEPVEYMENPVLTSRGEERIIAWHSTVVRDENGKITGTLSSGEDITERKNAEQALKNSEEKYRTLMDSLPVGVAISTADGTAIERNKTSGEMYRYSSKEEFLRVPPTELYVDLKDRKRFLALLEKGPVNNFEVRLKRKDGSIFWGELTALLKTSGSGGKQIITITQDIDKRKQAEKALKASEEKFRMLFENAPVGIGITTTEGRRVERNKTQVEMFGFKSREEMLSSSAIDRYVNPEDRKHYIELAGKGIVRSFEAEMRRIDGSTFWASISAAPFSSASGEQQFISIIQDITERKKAQEALKTSEELFRNLIENAPVGIAITTLGGVPIIRNATNQKMHGYDSKEEFMKVNSEELYYNASDRKRWMEVLKKSHVEGFEVQHKRHDGSTFWATLTAVPYTTEKSEKQLILITQDITEKKKNEEELRSSREELRNLSTYLQVAIEEERARIAREVHDELGQSLTALKLDLIWLQGMSYRRKGPYALKLQSMSQLLDDTIKLVREVSSELRPRLLDDFGLIAAMESALKEFSTRTGVKCAVFFNPDDINVQKDIATAICRVFQEALTNIARHAEATEVKVKLSLVQEQLNLSIEDNGKGIAMDKISSPRSLGLIGMRERMNYFGGNMQISSEMGKGTRITVTIPVKKEKSDDQSADRR